MSRDAVTGDRFGKWMVTYNETILVASPSAANNRGFVYVFNGTLRHWSQVQKLLPADVGAGGYFGDYMSLHKDRVIIGAKGTLGTAVLLSHFYHMDEFREQPMCMRDCLEECSGVDKGS